MWNPRWSAYHFCAQILGIGRSNSRVFQSNKHIFTVYPVLIVMLKKGTDRSVHGPFLIHRVAVRFFTLSVHFKTKDVVGAGW